MSEDSSARKTTNKRTAKRGCARIRIRGQINEVNGISDNSNGMNCMMNEYMSVYQMKANDSVKSRSCYNGSEMIGEWREMC